MDSYSGLATRFAAAGMIAALPTIIVMAGMEYFAPDTTAPGALFILLPPLSVALTLWWVSQREGFIQTGQGTALLAVVTSAVASWYAAQQFYINIHGAKEVIAGAIGGLVLAQPLPWIWRGGRNMIVLFPVAFCAGALGAGLDQLLRAVLHNGLLDQDRWLYVLMPIWQATMFTILAVTRQRIAEMSASVSDSGGDFPK